MVNCRIKTSNRSLAGRVNASCRNSCRNKFILAFSIRNDECRRDERDRRAARNGKRDDNFGETLVFVLLPR